MIKKIYLVGAGPGELDLLTLKAVKIIEQADVILYDALVNEEVFQFCKENCLKVNVGKRKGKHLKQQEEINDLLVGYAKTHEVVVRLKGGTPFVFGRGYEEVRAIKEAGFDVEIVSGVSSTTSVPESFMLPLVDRKFNDSYRTITGHDIDVFKSIVKSYHDRENLIIMMGVHNIKNIVEYLLSIDFPKDLPISVLSKGTTNSSSQRIFSLDEVNNQNEEFFEELKKLTPAILFIGRTIHAMKEIQ
ncbi:uroporphyrinogen-III C-methyltransferase [Arcobacter sp. F155]|uniref:uroporphyrinogen-III C-methyltransferase n=1 Tax=Arcobacter sp. F155 TaxID=2044512 RepID=UPI00100A5FB1|nr:uroporphyrinogen-III C-methyltransferase [Arcobacter sp. F155]RXJ78812.1 uroporphyrinogen-III C-methyltransferase [Arcobacter sp. F155]